MEKQQDYMLMKARSYQSVLSVGFHLYTENFRRLFKASWQMALLHALSCGATGTLATIEIPKFTLALMQQLATYQVVFTETLQHFGLTLLELLGLTVLTIATLALASAPILSKLKEHKDTGDVSVPPHWLTANPHLMGRTLKGCFLTLFIMLAPLVLFVALLAVADAVSSQFVMHHLMTSCIAFVIVTIAALLLGLPLMHVLMKYLMEAPCGYWHTLGSNYGRAMRHWGALFLVFFVSTLLVQLVTLIVMMPAQILQLANQAAHLGQLMGDPLTMPPYMTVLTFVTFVLTCFIQFYVSQVMLVHNYYIYGSIETKEYEKDTLH